ncbi:hypothetical protein BJY04DRAFT_5027 [Aspergillus karnatakaensis]|uniref:uncharacterized protein n=1 Tax=Aspergillus karnatakaensis TaxID=1810916 RepID=UPI003CCE3D2A
MAPQLLTLRLSILSPLCYTSYISPEPVKPSTYYILSTYGTSRSLKRLCRGVLRLPCCYTDHRESSGVTSQPWMPLRSEHDQTTERSSSYTCRIETACIQS